VFQRDLWALFDWSARSTDHESSRRELQRRLAEVLRHLALTQEQIGALPDTYAQAIKRKAFVESYDPGNPARPFLPEELFKADGPWVFISAGPTAIAHVQAFSGRSRFLVFIRLPGGRPETLRYLRRLWSFPEPLMIRGKREMDLHLNLRVPQFPVGTQVALVRQMIVFDREGNLVPTPVTESVQIRVYHSITSVSSAINYTNGPASNDQDFFEFRLSKRAFLARESSALAVVTAGEKEIPAFGSIHEESKIEILRSCRVCHADGGIHSVQSRTQFVRSWRPTDNPGIANYSGVDSETESILSWKRSRYDWGLLTGLWQAAPQP